MNILNVLQRGIFFAAICAVFSLMPWEGTAVAANTQMSQKILPVRFVYLEKDGSIERIWSNVTEKDDGYVVKFFDTKEKEIKADQALLGKYQSVVSSDNKDLFRLNKTVQFKNKGTFWEQIDTIV